MQRDRAWDIWQYICIGEIRFMNLYMSRFPEYPSIVKRLKEGKGEVLLDLGCCLGQDLRKLVFDGVPLNNIYGAELRPEFLDLSYELFQDELNFRSRLIVGDILDIHNSGLANLVGKVDIVYAGAFIHLFDWDHQVLCCVGIVNLLKPQRGSVVYGRQAGRSEAGRVCNLRAQDTNKTIYV
jgi:SAM-dependent methyltransferase